VDQAGLFFFYTSLAWPRSRARPTPTPTCRQTRFPRASTLPCLNLSPHTHAPRCDRIYAGRFLSAGTGQAVRLETLIPPLTCCWPALLSSWPILELAGKEAKFEAMIYVLSVVTRLPNRNHSGVRHQWLALPGYDHKHKGRTLRSSQNEPYVAGKRLVLASPLEGQDARLHNPREATRGSIVLMQRGTCSFIEKVERALAAGAAGVIIGNNDKAHPHAVFAMPGAWESLIKPKSVYEGLAVMVSFACFEQLRALLRLEAEFSAAAPSGSVLRVDMVPLHGGVDSFGQNLQEWEIGSAIRFLTLRNDHEKLQDLIRYIDATFLSHDVPQCGEEGYGPYNETDPDTGNTPVHIAVEHDSIQCLGHLLQCRMILSTDPPCCPAGPRLVPQPASLCWRVRGRPPFHGLDAFALCRSNRVDQRSPRPSQSARGRELQGHRRVNSAAGRRTGGARACGGGALDRGCGPLSAESSGEVADRFRRCRARRNGRLSPSDRAAPGGSRQQEHLSAGLRQHSQ
jgi:hypothetical protein